MTNATFSFETSPNTNPSLRENCGGDTAYYSMPPFKKVGGARPRVLQQIAPMMTELNKTFIVLHVVQWDFW